MGKGILGEVRAGICGLPYTGENFEGFCVLVSGCHSKQRRKIISIRKLKPVPYYGFRSEIDREELAGRNYRHWEFGKLK